MTENIPCNSKFYEWGRCLWTRRKYGDRSSFSKAGMRSRGIDVETSFWLRSITRNDATQVHQESQLIA